MSIASAISPFDAERENWWSKKSSGLAKRIFNLSLFVRSLQVQMRFGDLTRAPLRMIRLQLEDGIAECDWVARPPDIWDSDLRPEIGHRHASLQALEDAVNVRGLLFEMLPDLDTAYLRIYRESSDHSPEMIISGHVYKSAPSFRNVHSIAMRAKLLGFRFTLENDVLCSRAADEPPGFCG
jgi:hypothetical protein